MKNEEKNWYQILAIFTLIAYFILVLVSIDSLNLEVTPLNVLMYIFIGVILFSFMYGLGKIIQLLTSIDNQLYYSNHTLDSLEENPWELQEDSKEK